ncbi:hypothetical protein PTKIN_Ptkin17bG0139900 [Pterospermum kingtungense]
MICKWELKQEMLCPSGAIMSETAKIFVKHARYAFAKTPGASAPTKIHHQPPSYCQDSFLASEEHQIRICETETAGKLKLK